MSGNSKLRASVLVDLVDRFSAGARKMAGLSDRLGKGLAGAQAELKRLQVKWEYMMSTVKLKIPVAAG